MSRIDGHDRTPVAVFVDEPGAWSQALRHALDGLLLAAGQPEQQEP
jgi:hypothetical protein